MSLLYGKLNILQFSLKIGTVSTLEKCFLDKFGLTPWCESKKLLLKILKCRVSRHVIFQYKNCAIFPWYFPITRTCLYKQVCEKINCIHITAGACGGTETLVCLCDNKIISSWFNFLFRFISDEEVINYAYVLDINAFFYATQLDG